MSDPFAESTETVEAPGGGAASFFESGAPSCRFTNIGDMHQGKIVDFKESQQRDITTGEPASWPDGNPKMMLVVTLATTERSDEIEDDDGHRRLYVNKPSGMFAAIGAAIKASKGRFAAGGTLAVKYQKNGKPSKPGFNPPKEYIAKYTPPGAADSTPRDQSAGDSQPPTDAMKMVKQRAFSAMQKKMPMSSREEVAAAVKAAVPACFPGKTTDTMSLIQWSKIVEMDFTPIEAPYGDEQTFKDEDIPF